MMSHQARYVWKSEFHLRQLRSVSRKEGKIQSCSNNMFLHVEYPFLRTSDASTFHLGPKNELMYNDAYVGAVRTGDSRVDLHLTFGVDIVFSDESLYSTVLKESLDVRDSSALHAWTPSAHVNQTWRFVYE